MRKVLYILGQLSDREVEWLAANGTRRSIPKGQEIITMGQPLASIFFLLSGDMSVSADGIGEIARLKTGEIMGEMSMIDASPPSATVTALIDSKVLDISKQKLNEKMATDIEFSAHFYKAIAIFLSDRLRKTIKHLGYGVPVALDDEALQVDELDENVLDNVFLAGGRFDRMLKRLMGDE
ncbi:MAG TPA: cyclic nucleotide-binding domain-containing protein [Desulfuromonadales bacterium]|nr:cyclic nucleotide-binding domain-containing protein [Desulfuromonadales bacterium]